MAEIYFQSFFQNLYAIPNKLSLDFCNLLQTENNINVIDQFISDRKVDINGYCNLHRTTYFMLACQTSKYLNVIEYLCSKVNNIDNVNTQNYNAFLFACGKNTNLEIIKYLYNKITNKNQISHYGYNAYTTACKSNENIKVIKYLDEIFGHKHLNDGGDNGYAEACYNNKLKIVKYLTGVFSSAEIYAVNKDGMNAFKWAFKNNVNMDVIAYLIETIRFNIDHDYDTFHPLFLKFLEKSKYVYYTIIDKTKTPLDMSIKNSLKILKN